MNTKILAGKQLSRRSNVSLMIGAGCLALVISGCTRGSGLNQGGVLPSQQGQPKVANLEPAPLTPVRENQLEPVKPTPPPPPVNTVEATPVPAAPDSTPVQVAKLTEADAKPVTRQALIGAWTVSSGAANCQLFLALTKWSGGYRAAPRGCAATGISNVAAWDVKGKQVVLVGTSGATLATLFRSGGERYDGSIAGGGAISLSR